MTTVRMGLRYQQLLIRSLCINLHLPWYRGHIIGDLASGYGDHGHPDGMHLSEELKETGYSQARQ